jgi:hypothetical protein
MATAGSGISDRQRSVALLPCNCLSWHYCGVLAKMFPWEHVFPDPVILMLYVSSSIGWVSSRGMGRLDNRMACHSEDVFKLANLKVIIQCGTSNLQQVIGTALQRSRNPQGLLPTVDLLCWHMAPFFFLLPHDVGSYCLTAAAAASLVLASVVSACRVQAHEACQVHTGRFMSDAEFQHARPPTCCT